MRGSNGPDRRQASGRKSTLVVLAAFALLIQLMIPSAVMAARMSSGDLMVICTGTGIETVRAPDSGAPEKGFAGLPCQDCLGPASAALPAPDLAVLPVVYAVGRVFHAETIRPWSAPARAPPRPPGQAPPVLNV